jgi:hypothetical protein
MSLSRLAVARQTRQTRQNRPVGRSVHWFSGRISSTASFYGSHVPVARRCRTRQMRQTRQILKLGAFASHQDGRQPALTILGPVTCNTPRQCARPHQVTGRLFPLFPALHGDVSTLIRSGVCSGSRWRRRRADSPGVVVPFSVPLRVTLLANQPRPGLSAESAKSYALGPAA